MDAATVLADGFERVRGSARRAVDGLDRAELLWRPDMAANSIAWLVWHLARIQDDHVAEVAGHDQVWVREAWGASFGLPTDTRDTGFDDGPAEVATVQPSGPEPLVGYLDAVTDQTLQVLDATTPDDLDQVVDEAWDPPVTLGVRLVSVIGDGLQHAGQAAYVRGLCQRR